MYASCRLVCVPLPHQQCICDLHLKNKYWLLFISLKPWSWSSSNLCSHIFVQANSWPLESKLMYNIWPKIPHGIKSRPHCCMHGRSMLTEFLHGSGMLWEWWGESILLVHPTAQPMLLMCCSRHTLCLSSGFVDWSCNQVRVTSELATPLLVNIRNVQKPKLKNNRKKKEERKFIWE